ncbi:MAG: hypothetical protein ACK5HS_05390 [Mycoplasmatales bacterium]
MTNYESFEVSVSWEENLRENEKIRMAEQEFDDMWNSKREGLIVMSIPETIRNEIIKFSGGNFVFDESYMNNIILEDNNILDTKDAAIFHFENNTLTLVNTYTNESKLTSNYTFKNFVRSKLSDSIEETKFVFGQNISYVEILKINKDLEDYPDELKILEIASFKNFISNKQFHIDKVYKTGIAIKNKSEIIHKEFEKFRVILEKDMERSLKEDQLYSSFHMCKLNKVMNFSVPGSGKTTIVYGSFAYLNSSVVNKIDRIVMVGPISSSTAWKNEFILNFGQKKPLHAFDIIEAKKESTDITIQLKSQFEEANLILINYEILPNLTKELCELLDHRTLLVVDEVHKLKLVGGKRANEAIDI